MRTTKSGILVPKVSRSECFGNLKYVLQDRYLQSFVVESSSFLIDFIKEGHSQIVAYSSIPGRFIGSLVDHPRESFPAAI